MLVAKVDLARLGEILTHARSPLFALAVIAQAVATFANALRWHKILGKIDSPGWLAVLKLLWLGLFFNQVLPSGVGGDAVRAWRCRRLGMRFGTAVRSILIDRACGYGVLVAIYAACLPALLRVIHEPLQRHTLVGVLAMATGALVSMFLLDRLPARVVRHRAVEPFAELARDARRILLDPRRNPWLIPLSIVSVGLSVLAIDLAAASVGVVLSYGDWLMIVPPVTFIQLLPISLAGWGIREAAVVVMLAGFGIPAATAFAASLAMGVSLLVVALPGSIIWTGGWDVGDGAEPTPASSQPAPRA